MFVQKHNPNPREGSPQQMNFDIKSELVILSFGGSSSAEWLNVLHFMMDRGGVESE